MPRLLSVYHSYAVSLTNWENHAHQSTHDASLTIKTFSMSAIVAYLGLALSAFIYVPFGEEVMTFVHAYLYRSKHGSDTWLSSLYSVFSPNATTEALKATGTATPSNGGKSMWVADGLSARNKLSATRLQDQMFAFTVTNQVVNTFLEIGLPYVLRAVESMRNGRGLTLAAPAAGAGNGSGKKKRVMFEDQDVALINANEEEEREFMERVRREVALPDYTLFADYSEMVTQFGYVALWSTIWPLAPGECGLSASAGQALTMMDRGWRSDVIAQQLVGAAE